MPVMILSCLLGNACSPPPDLDRTILEQPNHVVGLEITYRPGSQEFAHPAEVGPETIREALQSIQTYPSSLIPRVMKRFHDPHPAFSDTQIQVLTQALSQALRQATALETATFFWVHPRENGIQEITSGGIYAEQHQLHLILANYRHTITDRSAIPSLKKQPLRVLGDPLYRLEALSPSHMVDPKLTANLWAPKAQHFLYPRQGSPTLQKSEEAAGTSLPSKPPAKERLNHLRELYREGLITDGEYQEKRKEILDGL